MSELTEYYENVRNLSNRAADLIEELIGTDGVDISRDKYKITFRVNLPSGLSEEYDHEYFEVWTANGKESLSLGMGAWDECKVEIPKGDQDRVWEMLEELNLPSYEL